MIVNDDEHDVKQLTENGSREGWPAGKGTPAGQQLELPADTVARIKENVRGRLVAEVGF